MTERNDLINIYQVTVFASQADEKEGETGNFVEHCISCICIYKCVFNT